MKFLLKKKIKKKIFNEIVNYVGSDLRLFFHNQGYLKNIKSIIKLKSNHKLFFLLAYPNIQCSTKEVFSNVKKITRKKIFSQKKLRKKTDFVDYIVNSNNDLQSIVEKKYPIIRNLINEISAEKGCYFSRMTGSGSVCYGVFRSDKSAKLALKKIKYNHPNYWLTVAKTI